MLNEKAVTIRSGRDAILDFLRGHTCYDLLRDSGKVVVFDTSIPIQLAFYALLEHDIHAAPLWDSTRSEFVGLLTVIDFIDLLRHYHQRGITMEKLASQSIAQVLLDPAERLRRGSGTEEFVAADVDGTLLDACVLLRRHRGRFLPIRAPEGSETGALAVISHADVLSFLVFTFREQRRLFDHGISELQIGTFEGVVTVQHDAPLRQVLEVLEARDISGVPVVDDEGRVVSVYSRADITFLATATDAESVISNLDLSVSEVLKRAEGAGERLHTCLLTATLQSIFELYAEVRFQRLVCVDDANHCVGLISVRDILDYFSREEA